jgi:excinuclease UvrABC helicase subunit UvrB
MPVRVFGREEVEMDYHELAKTKVDRLREMAKEYPDVTAAGLNKEQLIDLLCEKMSIEKPHKVATGVDKSGLKKQIRELKKERNAALEARDHEKLVATRAKIHRLRRQLRAAIRIR